MDIDLSPLKALTAEREIPFDALLKTLETALASAYQHTPGAFKHSRVEIDPRSGRVVVWAREVLEPPPALSVEDATENTDAAAGATPAQAAAQTSGAVAGEQAEPALLRPVRQAPILGPEFAVEVNQKEFGRIAAATARNVIFQGLRDAQDERTFGTLHNKQGELISGVIQKGPDPTHILVDVGGTEATLPPHEQVPFETYPHGQRIKAVVTEVNRSKSGPKVILSRSHPKLVRELFALEVPEVADGTVEIMAIAREAGHRSKVAVASRVPGLNAKGACIGPMGARVRAVMGELNGEKIDLIDYSPDPRKFVASALSPARVISTRITDDAKKEILVVVPDSQLSLAIGKEGQNARLAAKLTGWKIDIRSDSQGGDPVASRSIAAALAANNPGNPASGTNPANPSQPNAAAPQAAS